MSQTEAEAIADVAKARPDGHCRMSLQALPVTGENPSHADRRAYPLYVGQDDHGQLILKSWNISAGWQSATPTARTN